MTSLQEQLARLRQYRAELREADPEVAEESADLRVLAKATSRRASRETLEAAVEVESIAMRRERPVLQIFKNEAKLVFEDAADSEIWRARLEKAKPLLDVAIPAVGRIDLTGSQYEWVGTGWLVSDAVLVTNRHVAALFVERKGETLSFAMNGGRRVGAGADFLQEIDNPAELVFELVKPLHVEGPSGPDVAFFEIRQVSGDARLAKPIRLASEIKLSSNVAVIGYPASDSRIPEPELMERIYGRLYNKKRLAPGGVTRIDEQLIWHNCTTLGGNSGSVVLDLDEGEAVGLHFSGSFLKTNYAVRADVVRRLRDDILSGRRPRPSVQAPREKPAPSPVGARGGQTATVSIPLTVTVSVTVGAAAARPQARPHATPGGGDSAPVADDEAKPEDYLDRRGYEAGFLGEGFEVALPDAGRHADDVLSFEFGGETGTELRYEHFSVVMSVSRRMCFFSACNIDGALSKSTKRPAWRLDPRIPSERQIIKECYGDPPKFSRGHMARREDPAWGEDPETAKRGNADSMHVTNATPQMQAFNSPIWLALEDYALQNAREDDMKISVFTGPYFAADDPVRYGVLIPRAFWKVIAFIHDGTGELCATGYEMDQSASLPPAEEEFVFGDFVSPQLGVSTQVPIREIEARSGLDLHGLAEFDPLDGEEALAPAERPQLLAMEQIRFLR